MNFAAKIQKISNKPKIHIDFWDYKPKKYIYFWDNHRINPPKKATLKNEGRLSRHFASQTIFGDLGAIGISLLGEPSAPIHQCPEY